MDRFVQENIRPRFVMAESSHGRMLMLEHDYEFIYYYGRFPHPSGGIDWVAAAKAGVKIFTFVKADTLARNPEMKPYVCGDWDDLEAILRGGKIKSFYATGGILNPLQNVSLKDMRDSTPELEITRVTQRDFRVAFGQKRFTSLFPKD
jgi:hypothetical protein